MCSSGSEVLPVICWEKPFVCDPLGGQRPLSGNFKTAILVAADRSVAFNMIKKVTIVMQCSNDVEAPVTRRSLDSTPTS